MPLETLVSALAGLRDVALALTAGALVLAAFVVRGGSPAMERAWLIARVSSVAWAVLSIAFILTSYASIRNEALPPDRFLEETWAFLTTIDLGEAYLHMAAAAVAASVIAALGTSAGVALVGLIPVLWAIGWQAVTGHAAGASDHHLALGAMFIHLIGSALWLGVIGALLLMRGPLGGDAKHAVARGSRIAIWAAWLLVYSGVINAYIRLGSLSDLFTTTYGLLLTLKLALMALAVGLAAWHRRVNLPRLSEAQVQQRFWRVMAVDVGALVAVVLIAGLLSGTAPPVPIEAIADPSPAYTLTGYELPPEPTALAWITTWRLEAITLVGICAAVFQYLRWVVRLRRRGDAWPWYRTVLFLTSMALLVWITQGAPMVYGQVSFSGHMTEHMVLAMMAPLPLARSAPVTLALRALPARTDGSRGPREWLRWFLDSLWMKVLANPLFAAVNFAGSLVVFYYSPLFEMALRNHAGHIVMVVHFMAAGYLFANALIGVDPSPGRPSHPMRLVLLLSTMAFHAFFGISLMTSETLLAPTWYGLMGRTWGADAISDQQYGGQIAWGLGELPTLILAIGVVTVWRAADAKERKRRDRKADRDGDAELEAYNAMLREAARSDG